MEGSKFYITGTDEYSVYLVYKLSSYVDIISRNVSTDCYFTSVTIAHYLKEKKKILVGTMRVNRKCIPKELAECKIVMIRISSSLRHMKMIWCWHRVSEKISSKEKTSKEKIRQEKYFIIEHNAWWCKE